MKTTILLTAGLSVFLSLQGCVGVGALPPQGRVGALHVAATVPPSASVGNLHVATTIPFPTVRSSRFEGDASVGPNISLDQAGARKKVIDRIENEGWIEVELDKYRDDWFLKPDKDDNTIWYEGAGNGVGSFMLLGIEGDEKFIAIHTVRHVVGFKHQRDVWMIQSLEWHLEFAEWLLQFESTSGEDRRNDWIRERIEKRRSQARPVEPYSSSD